MRKLILSGLCVDCAHRCACEEDHPPAERTRTVEARQDNVEHVEWCDKYAEEEWGEEVE